MESKGFPSSGSAVKGREIGRLVVAVSLATSLLCLSVTGPATAQGNGKGRGQDVPSYDPRFYTYDAQNHKLTPIPGAATDAKRTRPSPGTGLKATDDWAGTGPKAGYQGRAHAAVVRDHVIAGASGGPSMVMGGTPSTPEERAATEKMLVQDEIARLQAEIKRTERLKEGFFAFFGGDRTPGIIENLQRRINILNTKGYDAYEAERRKDAAYQNWFLIGAIELGGHLGH